MRWKPLNGVRLPRSRAHGQPWVWGGLAYEWWQLSDRDSLQLWEAIAASCYERPSQLREQLQSAIDFYQLIEEMLTPKFALAMIDDLVHERRLTRWQGSRIQDKILAQMSAKGGWL